MSRPELRFRLNGAIIPEIRVRRALVQGQPVGTLEIAVRDPWIGWFAIDDNGGLADSHLPRFILECRDEIAWSEIDPLLRRIDPLKGWRATSPRRLLEAFAVDEGAVGGTPKTGDHEKSSFLKNFGLRCCGREKEILVPNIRPTTGTLPCPKPQLKTRKCHGAEVSHTRSSSF